MSGQSSTVFVGVFYGPGGRLSLRRSLFSSTVRVWKVLRPDLYTHSTSEISGVDRTRLGASPVSVRSISGGLPPQNSLSHWVCLDSKPGPRNLSARQTGSPYDWSSPPRMEGDPEQPHVHTSSSTSVQRPSWMKGRPSTSVDDFVGGPDPET